MSTPQDPRDVPGETPGETPGEEARERPTARPGRRRAAGPAETGEIPVTPHAPGADGAGGAEGGSGADGIGATRIKPGQPGRRARAVAPDSAPTTGEIPLPVIPPAPAPAPVPAPVPSAVPAGGPEPEPATEPEKWPATDESPAAADDRPDAAPSRRRIDVRRSIDPVLLLALTVPLVTVGALATVHPAATEDGRRDPGQAPLTRTQLVCPAGLPGSEDVSVALADSTAGGEVTASDLAEGGDPVTLNLTSGKVQVRRVSASTILAGTGDSAVGLVAVRGDAALGTACQAPRSDVWFTGVGAGPEHTSRLRLVNPDSGPAIADVEVLTADGPVEVKALRGLAVAPHQETVIDLDAVVPEREDMSLRVTVPRGRLALSMTDTFQEIGSDVQARSWLGSQRAGTRTTHLLGVEKGAGERTLVLANAGTDEARVKLNLVTAESEFAPTGVEVVTVAPGSTRTVELGKLLNSRQADGVLGVRLDSEVPVTATLRTVRGKRVQHTVGAPNITAQAATVVPGGGGALVLGGTTGDTTVTVTQRTVEGRSLAEKQVTVREGTAVRVPLEKKAGLVSVVVDGAPVRGAVVAGVGDPAQVRVLEELARVTAVPHVRPALK